VRSSAKPPVTARKHRAPRKGCQTNVATAIAGDRQFITDCGVTASVALDPLLAPLLGAINFCSHTGGLHCVPTSGYCLATLRVAVP
jgi:hypothetical protein